MESAGNDGWSVEENEDTGVDAVERCQGGASRLLLEKQQLLLPNSELESDFPDEVVASP